MIRPATATDAEAIAGIWNAQIATSTATFTTTPKTLPELVASIQAQPFVVTGSPVRGFASLGQFRGGPGYAATSEHSIYVDPAAQGRGRGHALLAALEDLARAGGIHVMVAGCAADNLAARSLHASHGFEVTAHMPQVGRKFGAWQDLVLMQKILASPLAAPGSGR